jgi:hypothetical protein
VALIVPIVILHLALCLLVGFAIGALAKNAKHWALGTGTAALPPILWTQFAFAEHSYRLITQIAEVTAARGYQLLFGVGALWLLSALLVLLGPAFTVVGAMWLFLRFRA